MKRFAVLFILVFTAGIFIGRFTPHPAIIRENETSTKTVLTQKFATIKVARVIDGDTIELEGGERVRYIGIDAPELEYSRKQVQCFADESKKKNQELVEGKEIRLEKDTRDRDAFGRLLRYVYRGNVFINLELVRQGFALTATYPPDVKYQADFLKAQKEAGEAKRGLWGGCVY